MNQPQFTPPFVEKPTNLSRLNELKRKASPILELPPSADPKASAKGLEALENMKPTDTSTSVARVFRDVKDASTAGPSQLEQYLKDLN